MIRRRTVLSAAAAGIGGVIALAPRAHADAMLDADVDVTDWTDEKKGIGEIYFELDSHADQPITPACLCWGEGRQAQQPWDVVSGPMPLPPGETAEYHITTPIDSRDVYLLPNKAALLQVFDKGRDARALDRFVPEVTEVSSDG